MSKTHVRMFVTGFKQKNMKRHPIIMINADYDYILYEIERHEKVSLKGM